MCTLPTLLHIWCGLLGAVLLGLFVLVVPWWFTAAGLVALLAALPAHQRWQRAQAGPDCR